MRPRRSRQLDGQHGQGLVEFALVLPIILVVVLSVAELGFIFGKLSSLGYGSREGARTGAALARGKDVALCDPVPALYSQQDPKTVDAVTVAAVQRVLESRDSGIDMSKIQAIRIFQADDAGGEAGPVNVWTWVGNRLGSAMDPDFGGNYIDFDPGSLSWPVCGRVHEQIGRDSIGVTVIYKYDFVTPIPALADAFAALAGGDLSLTLSETTVMSLNPSK